MKLKIQLPWRGLSGRTIAMFGQARLVRTRAGHFELRGGSRRDVQAAREWTSLFLHEAVCANSTETLPQPWWQRTQS